MDSSESSGVYCGLREGSAVFGGGNWVECIRSDCVDGDL